jgi:acetylornithine deacetylase/succinyl-diaminopimelate desuccinylase-like protein
MCVRWFSSKRTGAEGFPTLQSAGNVLRPYSSLKLSFRIPPNVSAKQAHADLKKIFEENPPYGAHVSFSGDKTGDGWEAPALADWLEEVLDSSSNSFFKKPANYLGEGGSVSLSFVRRLTVVDPLHGYAG